MQLIMPLSNRSPSPRRPIEFGCDIISAASLLQAPHRLTEVGNGLDLPFRKSVSTQHTNIGRESYLLPLT